MLLILQPHLTILRIGWRTVQTTHPIIHVIQDRHLSQLVLSPLVRLLRTRFAPPLPIILNPLSSTLHQLPQKSHRSRQRNAKSGNSHRQGALCYAGTDRLRFPQTSNSQKGLISIRRRSWTILRPILHTIRHFQEDPRHSRLLPSSRQETLILQQTKQPHQRKHSKIQHNRLKSRFQQNAKRLGIDRGQQTVQTLQIPIRISASIVRVRWVRGLRVK